MNLPLARTLSLSTVLFGLFYINLLPVPLGWSQGGLSPQELSSKGVSLGATVVAVAPAHVASSGNAMMASAILSNGSQQIAVYDQSKSTMAVYHIDSSTGDIQLKSVRKMDADFALQEFNLSEPTPSTIRKNVR